MIIYLATNKINGKRYIGATRHSIAHRRMGHWRDANGRNFCRKFGAALKKYGLENFDWEVLKTCESKEEMISDEIRLIAELKPEYNITIGGQGIVGIPYTEERRAKLSKSLTGRKKSRSELEKLLRSLEKAWVKNKKSIFCLTDGRFFGSVNEAAAFYNIRPSDISHVIAGEWQFARGLAFIHSASPLSEADRIVRLSEVEQRKATRIRNAQRGRVKPVECTSDRMAYADAAIAAAHYGMTPGAVKALCYSGGRSQSGLSFKFVGENRVKKVRSAEEIARGIALRDAGRARGILKISRPVLCVESGAVYDSISAAARAVGRCIEAVSKSIRRNGRCGGRTFVFVDEQRSTPEKQSP